MTSSLFENQNPSTHSLLSVDSATNHPSPSYQNEKKKKKKKNSFKQTCSKALLNQA
jgi:hypothetical protein